MAVIVHLAPYLRRLAGGAEEVSLGGAVATVGEALSQLFAAHPGVRDRVMTETGEIRQHVNVFAGEDNIRFLSGLQTPVSGETRIFIIPAVSGG